MSKYKEIEDKWQKAWAETRLFESEPNGKKSFMVTAAFPYANAPQHIGHLRTFGTADVLARYKRMQGFNVLYPMAFHVTGTPILAFAKRLKNKDPALIAELKLFHIPDAEIEKMTDPIYIANYFVKEIEVGMRLVGYSIDWRRKFISIDPFFSKFIEWQFGILNSKGYLIQGKHPVGWCPNENNAVGMHDTKHDVEPDIDQALSVKFKIDGEEAYFICTTYRPETISGVTNLFVNDSSQYVLCKIEGEEGNYYISKAAAAALTYQFKVEVTKEVTGKELLAKKCSNPLSGTVLPVLPGFFVKDNFGTGVVMSVPAHAPFDYAAIMRLKASGYPMPDIKPVKVIEVKDASGAVKTGEYIDLPALAYLKATNADINATEELLETATKLQYKEESHMGRMITPGFEGMKETEAREKISADLIAKKAAFKIYILTNVPVKCRCGYDVVVKVVDNQWFINYGDKTWKEKTRELFKDIRVLPEKTRRAFDAALDWIDLRAAERAQGLGTPFPLNPKEIIESLSDSTIYMSFYTIVNVIREIPPEKLKPELFDYIFTGKGNIDAVSKSTGIDYEVIRRCKDSFDYWYTETSRHSGPDLIFNHLTMYMFNHTAIFEKKNWPKQIAVNGSVLSEGEKMSKSLGNIVPLVDAVDKHGADMIRFVVVAGADLFSDSEYSAEAVAGVSERFDYINNLAMQVEGMESTDLKHIDYWLYSKLNRKIKDVTALMEDLELRSASTKILYDSIIELKRYASRGGNNAMALKDYIASLVLMLCPVTPHLSEEMWHMMGNSTFACVEKWPIVDEAMISDKIEAEEEMLDGIIKDSKMVMDLMKKKSDKDPKEIRFIISDDWKRTLTNSLSDKKKISEVIAEMQAGKFEEVGEGKRISQDAGIKYLNSLAKKINGLKRAESTQADEVKMLTEAAPSIEAAVKCKVVIEKESESKSARASGAVPGRPVIDIVTG